MRIFSLLILMVPTIALAHKPPPRQPRPQPIMIQHKLTYVHAELVAIEHLISSLNGNARTLNSIQKKLDGLKIMLVGLVPQLPRQIAPVIVVPVPVPVPVASTGPAPEPPPKEKAAPKGPVAMNRAEIASLLASVKGQAFADTKLKVVRTAAVNNYFTVKQVGALLGLLSFADDKLKAVRIVRDRIVDTKQFFELYNHFTFEADKKALKRILSGN